MVLMYFSGVHALQQIISPRIDGMYVNSQREFGLLENMQNVLLIAIVIIAGRAVFKPKPAWERAGFSGIALLSVFVLLEEMDYGLHI